MHKYIDGYLSRTRRDIADEQESNFICRIRLRAAVVGGPGGDRANATGGRN
jgi:hypothetical protein